MQFWNCIFHLMQILLQISWSIKPLPTQLSTVLFIKWIAAMNIFFYQFAYLYLYWVLYYMLFCSILLCTMVCCWIWSWSPMPGEKPGPRDSVNKIGGRRLKFLLLLRPEGHVFHTAWETMNKTYYSTLADWFFQWFIHISVNFSA